MTHEEQQEALDTLNTYVKGPWEHRSTKGVHHTWTTEADDAICIYYSYAHAFREWGGEYDDGWGTHLIVRGCTSVHAVFRVLRKQAEELRDNAANAVHVLTCKETP